MRSSTVCKVFRRGRTESSISGCHSILELPAVGEQVGPEGHRYGGGGENEKRNTQLPVAVESKPRPHSSNGIAATQGEAGDRSGTDRDRVRRLNMVMANGNAPPPTPATKAQTIAVDGGANRMPK